jgi:hypothetical protein
LWLKTKLNKKISQRRTDKKDEILKKKEKVSYKNLWQWTVGVSEHLDGL